MVAHARRLTAFGFLFSISVSTERAQGIVVVCGADYVMSSDSETTSVDYDNLSKNIIIEVEKRPALYDKSLNQYRDRNIKARLWQEVFQNVCREWTNLSETEKKNKGNSIQKKWKNMKDCFAKELAAQQGKSGQAAPPKKKKYVHFDSMLFLIPSMQKRETSCNLLSHVSTQDENVLSPVSTQDIKFSGPAQNSQPSNNNKISLRRKNCSRDNDSTGYEKQLLDILKDKQVQDTDDEEKNFALMLVPMLRKLNEDQKHYAKIEILNVLKKARSHSSPQPSQHILNQPSQFRGPRISSSPLYNQTYNQPVSTYQYQYSPQSSSMDTVYSIPSPSSTMPPPSPSPQTPVNSTPQIPSTTILQAPTLQKVQIIDQEILRPASATANYFSEFGYQIIEDQD